MKRLAAVLLGSMTLIAAAQDGGPAKVTFSKYNPPLRLASYDEQTHTHRFQGKLTLTGRLFLVFDMEAPDRANGEINFQKFVPDPSDIPQLPAVVAGFYPGPVRYISVDAPLEKLVAVFGGKEEFARVSHGTSHEVSRRAKLMIDEYSATVECDSRGYFAHVVSVTAVPEPKPKQLASREAPHGC